MQLYTPAAKQLIHLSFGAATLPQVIEDHDAFLEEMSCKVIACELASSGIIPESVKCEILQSKNEKEANAHLLQHLKKDAGADSVRTVFRIAAEKTGYGRMNTFAADMLKKLQRGLYSRGVHTHAVLVHV